MNRLFLLALAACGGVPPIPAGVTAEDPALAPLPFTELVLREHNVEGRFYAFRISSGQAPDMRRTMRFTRPDADGAWVISTVALWESADAPAETTSAHTSWSELQGHAGFPQADTQRTWSSYPWNGAMKPCLLYTVSGVDGQITEACFDLDLAGPPVALTEQMNGTVLFRMVLVELRVVPPG